MSDADRLVAWLHDRPAGDLVRDRRGEIRFVAPTAWFLPAQAQAALPIGGKWRIGEVERRHLLAEAVGWGIPDREARRTITSALDALAGGRADADRRFPAAPDRMRAAVDAQLLRLASSDW